MKRLMNKLTASEARVMLHKATEAPFSGRYDKHFEKGTYLCRQCGTRLFRSDAKFDSGTGWPSFDDAVPGSVKELLESDGRSEIVCARCGGHLGHVFRGERLTDKSVRHCVNSVALDFEAR